MRRQATRASEMFLVARGTAPRAKRATLKMATVTRAWAGVSSRRSQAVCAAKVARVTRTGAARETAVLSARARAAARSWAASRARMAARGSAKARSQAK
jgi:hypothetical protein